MQRKVESKQKLEYNSTKDYQSNKESMHKTTNRPIQTKSTQIQKLTKSNTHSTSRNKLHSKTQKCNQNFNSINVPENAHKNKNTHHQSQNFKKQPRKQQKLTRNSSEKLIKSKSALRLVPKTQRNRNSQSPIMFKEQMKQDEKPKTSKSARTKMDKEKKPSSKNNEQKLNLKRSSSMAIYHTKKQNTERNNANRVSIKTEGSSKMNSVIKDELRYKKSKKSLKPSIMKKQGQERLKQKLSTKVVQKTKLESKIKKSILYSQVSFQQFCQQNPCESALVVNEKLYLPQEYNKVKTEGCQVSCLENRFTQKNAVQLQTEAAIKIQKVFRGYITRKYIQQAKIIIAKVKIIQKWWRKIQNKRKRKPNKPSVENSLITIKDFNETMKSERHKLFSQSKQNTLSNRKLNIKEIIKNILQENELQSQKSAIVSQKKLKDSCLSPESNITKQVYIQHKIQAEINSQKMFNSPKLVTSPRSMQTPTSMVSIKDFFNNSSQRQKFKEMLQSPKIKSPQPPKSTPKSVKKQEETQKFQIYRELASYIQPFQTNFQAIQQISLILVDYFRDRPNQMANFLTRIQKLKYFRTELVLKNWKEYKLLTQSYYNQIEDSILPSDYQFLQLFQKPSLFPQKLRQDIIKFPSVQIDLNNKNYNLEDETNRPIHRCYLYFIFDVLEEAFYQSYRECVLQWKSALNLRLYDCQKNLFQFAFSDALGYLCKWGQIMCGFMVNHPEEYAQQREQRMKLMEKQIQPWDLGKANKLGIKIQISQKIEEDLWLEILSEFIKIQR